MERKILWMLCIGVGYWMSAQDAVANHPIDGNPHWAVYARMTHLADSTSTKQEDGFFFDPPVDRRSLHRPGIDKKPLFTAAGSGKGAFPDKSGNTDLAFRKGKRQHIFRIFFAEQFPDPRQKITAGRR